MTKKLLKILFLLIVLPLFLSACSWPWKKTAPAPDSTDISAEEKEVLSEELSVAQGSGRLEKFNNHEELALWLADNNNPLRAGFSVRDSQYNFNQEDDVASFFDYQALSPLGLSSYEADVVREDGTHIYALVREELFVIKVDQQSGHALVLSKIAFKSRPQGLILHENSLLVFGRDEHVYDQELYQGFRRQGPYVFVKVFDISSPANPRPTRDLSFEGSYRDLRLVGDQAYLLTETQMPYFSSEPLLPRLVENGRVLPQQCTGSQRCFSPEVYYFDWAYEDYRFLSISQIDLKNHGQSLIGQVYLLDPEDNFYFSDKNIYLSTARPVSEQDVEYLAKREVLAARLSAIDQGRLKEIEDAPTYLLNIHEKRAKALQMLDRFFNSLSAEQKTEAQTNIVAAQEKKSANLAAVGDKTLVHKISIDQGVLAYQVSGEVSGRLVNAWSISEYENNLRLATFRHPSRLHLGAAASSAYSNIYVMDKDLKIIGRLENLATAEKIYALRFFSRRAYIATVKPDDPLFIIDLSDKTKPQVLNAVKVPGFGNYLHPADPDGYRLFSLGRAEAGEGEASAGSLKLSLYNFTNPTQPKEEDSYIIQDGGGQSIAFKDHRSFYYSLANKTVSFPAALNPGGSLNFAGTLLFSLSDQGLSFSNRIDHSAGGHFTQVDFWQGLNYYDNTVRRSWLSNNRFFTFSNKFLKIHNPSDWSEIYSLILTPSREDELVNTPTVPDENLESNDSGAGASANGTAGSSGVNDEGGGARDDLLDLGANTDNSGTEDSGNNTPSDGW